MHAFYINALYHIDILVEYCCVSSYVISSLIDAFIVMAIILRLVTCSIEVNKTCQSIHPPKYIWEDHVDYLLKLASV